MAIGIATLVGSSAILLWAESPRSEWGPLARLSGEGAIASRGGRVCAIWEEGQVFDGAKWSGDPALHACVSDDHGRTWSEPRRITFVNAPNGWATHAKSGTLHCRRRAVIVGTTPPTHQR